MHYPHIILTQQEMNIKMDCLEQRLKVYKDN